MSYNVTGNVTLKTLTTFADDTTLTFLEDVTVQTATTLLNTRVQFGDAADDIATFNPGFNATAVPLFSFAGRMLTNSNPISISSVTLLANSEFDTGTGSAAADITIGTIFGTSALTLDTGATAGGSISLTTMEHLTGGLTIRDAGDTVTLGTLGLSGSGPITITHAQAGVTFSNDVFATTLTITDTADNQTILFADNRMVRLTTLSTTAQAYNLDIRSSSFNVTNDADLLNTGTLALGNGAADLLNFNGGLRAVGQSAITLAGQLTTSNARVALAALTLNSSSSIASGTAAASTISLGAVTAGTFNLSIAAGTNPAAAFTASSITGSGKLTVASAGSATLSGAVSMATVELGTITGAVSFSNNLSASTFTTTS
ncbi:MAG: hypothetical protein ACKPHU_31440, partial [Planctomycetaceae bacterium]